MASSAAMTMLRLTKTQRAIVADKFPDLANLFAGGFVIGPFLGARAPSSWLFVVGLVT